jgi:hypothetical protein
MFPLRWRIETDWSLAGIVEGHVSGERCLFLTGSRTVGDRHESVVLCINAAGETIWEQVLSHPSQRRTVCVYPNVIDVPGVGVCLFYSTGEGNNGNPKPGEARLVRAIDGSLVWSSPSRSHHVGNGSCLWWGDLDGEGRMEIVWWDSTTIFCETLVTGERRWQYDDRVAICHGRPCLADVDGDGLPEIVAGTEYSNPDGTSSVVALRGTGEVVWRSDGFADDLGSTPVMAADVNGDGRLEFLITGLDLEHRGAREWSSLWCFSDRGELLYRADCGCGSIAALPGEFAEASGSVDLCGVGTTNRRDGGTNGVSAIRCFDLRDGSVRWERRIDRTWLDAQNPVAADLTGDGRPDVLCATANPSGYGRDPRWEPYGDVYAVSLAGEILWRHSAPDFVHQPFVTDIDGDGRNEIIIVCADGTVMCFDTPGIAVGDGWSMTGGGSSRLYLQGSI